MVKFFLITLWLLYFTACATSYITKDYINNPHCGLILAVVAFILFAKSVIIAMAVGNRVG